MADDRTVAQDPTGFPVRSLRIEVVAGPDAKRAITTGDDSLSIGTEPSNDLVLADPTVSRYHAELTRQEHGVLVEDKGSTNGTRVGAVRIDRASVAPGTVLELGTTRLRVDDGDTVNVDLHDGPALGSLVGGSPGMRRLMAQVSRAARSDASILLLGETGTGKEVVARTIHEASARAGRAFETVDCGAMLPTLIASELFGHERGAFTGADRQYVGAFERADGGTLFLDEIGELPAALQTALLGALERRRFRRLGGSKEISVDLRVVSATNRDLRAEVNNGGFRQDVYFRLAVVMLKIPSLRDRVEDIPLLSRHFLRQLGCNDPIEEVLPESVMSDLTKHRWPGNVRELRNTVEAALVMGEAPTLGEDSAPPVDEESTSTLVDDLLGNPFSDARSRAIERFEKLYVDDLLTRNAGNVSQGARVAKIDRSYLTRLMKRHGIRFERRATDS